MRIDAMYRETIAYLCQDTAVDGVVRRRAVATAFVVTWPAPEELAARDVGEYARAIGNTARGEIGREPHGSKDVEGAHHANGLRQAGGEDRTARGHRRSPMPLKFDDRRDYPSRGFTGDPFDSAALDDSPIWAYGAALLFDAACV